MKFAIFKKYTELKYGISEKSDGAMELDGQILNGVETGKRQAYFEKLGIPQGRAVAADLVHGVGVRAAGEKDAGTTIAETDGLITTADNLFLTITVADCFPVYFFDPNAGVIGLVHAGWRGISQNIIKESAKVLEKSGAIIKNVLIGIGPGVRECHFEAKEDVAKLFGTRERFINLSEIIQNQLIGSGIAKNNIEDTGECTYCLAEKYFSYRRDKPAEVQAMLAYIGKITR